MKFSIIINPKSQSSDACYHAYAFINALLKQNQHTIQVFFYGYAVSFAYINDARYDWSKLVKNDVQLRACSTIADVYEQQNLKLNNNFSVCGLGLYMEMLISTDKRVEFV